MTAETSPLLESLEAATRGLLYPSESDFPIEPYTFGPETPTPDGLLRALGKDASTAVEQTTFGALFDGLDDERLTALASLLARELTELRAYRLGKTNIDIVVLGRHPSGVWLGVTTRVVET